MTFISKVANISAYCFLILTFILTGICIISIWAEFGGIMWKTFSSMGLVSLAFFVILVVDGSGHFRKPVQMDAVDSYMRAVEDYVLLRKVSFFVVIFTVTISVFLGLLSIWGVLEGIIIAKTLGTIMSVGFYALVTMLVCKQREGALKSVTVITPSGTANVQSAMVAPPLATVV